MHKIVAHTLCNNCGKQGHSFHQCKLPITSYGIILCRPSSKGFQFLMIRRKDSFGYIDFIRGKYSPYNIEQLQHTINEKLEKRKISLSEFYVQYYEAYKPKEVKLTEYYRLREKAIYLGIVCLIGSAIYYLYEK